MGNPADQAVATEAGPDTPSIDRGKTSLVVQPGPDTGADTTIVCATNGAGSWGNTNFGRLDYFAVGLYDDNTVERSLLRFALPAGLDSRRISKATMVLQTSSWAKKHMDGRLPVSVHRMLRPWKQGLGNRSGYDAPSNSATIDGATGTEPMWGQSWNRPGAALDGKDAKGTPEVTVDKLADDMSPWVFDLTTLVKEWATDPATNLGLLLKSNEVLQQGRTYSFPLFFSSESNTASSRPRLEIELSN